MNADMIILLLFAGLIVGIFSGFPAALVLGGLSMIFGMIFIGPDVLGYFIVRLEGMMTNYTLLAVPFFLFMGVFIETSGIAEKLFNALYIWCGRLRGGLAVSTVIMAILFAATTGIVGASVITIGLIALPAMLAKKYNTQMACGAICAGGTLGILIPPSVLIIVYGPIVNLSVGKLFMAAYLPGILLGVLYIIYIVVRCYIYPEDGPTLSAEELKIPFKKKMNLMLTSIVPIGAIIFSVLGSILFGVASVTEAGAVGAFATITLSAFSGTLTLKLVKQACIDTLKITSVIMLIAVGAFYFSAVFIGLGGDGVVTKAFQALPLGRWGIFVCFMLMLVVAGALIDWMSILFIIIPIITPVAVQLGFDPLWFAGIVMVNLQISFLSPPFAYSLFYLKGICPPEVKTTDIYWGVMPYIGIQLFVLLLCIIFPELITYLPGKFVV